MFKPPSAALRTAAVLLVLPISGALLAGCNPEADLIAYFGTPSPPAGPTASPTRQAAPSPTVTTTPTASPTVPPPTPSPTSAPTPTTTPAWSPMPTRPPNLASFPTLRERARAVEVSRLAARPAQFLGTTVYFEGRVNRVVEDRRGNVRARIKIGESFIHLLYNTGRYWGDHPLVQGDRVRFVGQFVGVSDEAATGERLPEIEVIDLVHRFT